MAEEFRLDTPEAVTLAYDVAGIGTRFLATAVDTLIMAVAWIVIAIVGFAMIGAGGGLVTVGILVLITGAFVSVWGYYIAFETFMRGRTPGKAWLKIRVLTTEGYPIGFGQAAIRNLMRSVDFLPALYGVGIITMFISAHARRLGDYAAGTVVVKERPAAPFTGREGMASGRVPGSSQPALGAVNPEEHVWNLAALTDEQVRLARRFLARAPTLPDDARSRIGNEIALQVAAAIGSGEPLNAVQYLERVLYLWEQAFADRARL